MKLNRSFSSHQEQLGLRFRIDSGLPLAVSPRSMASVARREFASTPDASLPERQFQVMRYAEKVALLRNLRRSYRRAVCHKAGGSAALYAATPEGRRVHRTMQTLMQQIAAERNSLCG